MLGGDLTKEKRKRQPTHTHTSEYLEGAGLNSKILRQGEGVKYLRRVWSFAGIAEVKLANRVNAG